MTSGIFHVEFRASTDDFGDGLVVVKDGAVNGGDPHYLYQGEVPTHSGEFESRFTVRKYRDGNANVVGIDNYTRPWLGWATNQNTRLAHSFICETWMRRDRPPISIPSSI